MYKGFLFRDSAVAPSHPALEGILADGNGRDVFTALWIVGETRKLRTLVWDESE